LPDRSPSFTRLISYTAARKPSAVTRFGVTSLAVALVAWVRSTLVTSLLPWLLFMPVILLASLMFGRKEGIWATFFAATLAGVTVAPPNEPYLLTGNQWIATALFVLINLGIVEVGHELRKALARYREAEAQLRLLNGELAHRLKNILSIVQAVTLQSLRQADDMRSARVAIGERLAALGKAADLLSAGSWESAHVGELVRSALSAHGGAGRRIEIAGPDLVIPPQQSMALALALHELATNATKYGALASEDGRVEVRWSMDDYGATSRFRLEWREKDGPPVAPPTRAGFGTMLIERSLQSYFRGDVRLEYAPDGFRFVLDAPLPFPEAH
jgi:two-component sensor histidine kinase